MSGGENIRQVLKNTGIYNLPGNSPVDHEVEAYAAGLEIVEDAMERLEKDLFALTATPERLAQWELLYRGQAAGGNLEARRKAAAQALGRQGGPVTAGNLDEILEAAGIRGTWEEVDGKLVIHATEYLCTSETEAKRLLGRLLPAHWKWEVAAS